MRQVLRMGAFSAIGEAMSKVVRERLVFAAAVAMLAAGALAAGADLGQAQKQATNWTAIGMFGVFVVFTLFITKWAAAKTKSAADFYTAGGGITGFQNGLAIAGDYMSAASFLGIAGLISLYGYDGFMYSVGWLVAYITVLLVIAEPCRNIGKYTMGDILAFRNDPKKTKTVAALSTITVSTFYLTAQMVGGGVHHSQGHADWQVGRRLAYGSLPAAALTLWFLSANGGHQMKSGLVVQMLGAVLIATAVVLDVRRSPKPSPFSGSSRSSLLKLWWMSECVGSVTSAPMRRGGPR